MRCYTYGRKASKQKEAAMEGKATENYTVFFARKMPRLAERPNDDLVIGNVLREAARVFDSGDCETVAAALVHAFEALSVGPRAQRMVEERVERHGSLDEAIDAL